jgi:PAS domain S-box-containing protein
MSLPRQKRLSRTGGLLLRGITQGVLVLLLVCEVVWPVQAAGRGPQGIVRVGIFSVEPLNWIDDKGVAQGLNPDLLRELAYDADWDLRFVHCNWAECFEQLQREEIDLMVSVAYSSERAATMDYNHEPVAELWGQVFVRPEGSLPNITHLAGKRVAVMRQDINGVNFINTASHLGVQCTILEYTSHAEVFAAVAKGEADAGVAPQHYGLRHAPAYHLVGSSILFNPLSIYFASKKGRHHELLSFIDAHLVRWKQNKDSVYYQSLNKWLGSAVVEKRLPTWLYWTLLVTTISILVFAAISIHFKRKFLVQTEALRKSEERFNLAMQAATDGLFDWDLEKNVIYYSPGWKHILGYQDEELANEVAVWERLTDPKDLERSWEIMREHLAGRRDRYESEFRMHHKNGHWVDILSRGNAILNEAGKPVRVIGTHVDITERKRMEDALRDSEERFRLAMLASRDGLWDWNIPDNHVYYSPSWAEILNETQVPAELSSWEERIHPEDKPNTLTKLKEHLEGKKAYWQQEHRLRMSDGNWKWVLGRGMVITRDIQGNPLRMVGTMTDITERKQAEKELQRQEVRYRTIVENLNDAFYIHDFRGHITDLNENACHQTGYTREEMLAGGLGLIDTPENAAAMPERMAILIKKGALLFEGAHRRKNGSLLWVSISARVISCGGDGLVQSFVRDITERKRAEEEKNNLNAQLQQAQKLEAIGTLAGGIAHDFNNILGAIVGYSEIIRDDLPPDSPGIRSINQVLKASNRAKDLVKQILAFSRQAEGQKIPMQPEGIVKETIALLRSSLPTTITIKQEIDPDAGMVLADPTQMHQIVMNLCTNAFHAMEVKGGTLTISLQKKILCQDDLATEPDLQPGTFVQLSIRDTGEGILPEIRKRIFDPFFTTKEVGKGTGLGLSMVYSIVKSSGGSIACDSRVGEGTEFRILLPALEGHSAEESDSTDLIPHGKEHILLIDDEEMLVELGQAMLEHLGYQVTARTSSLEALATYQSNPHHFDAVITDQTMPGMTGLDLALRMLHIRPDLPIILCTGYSNLVDEAQARACGIKGFAMKPLTKKDIAVLLRATIKESHEPPTAA